MTTKTIDGIAWQTETPSKYIYDDVTVRFCRSEYTGRRWWCISTRDEGDLDGAYETRHAAMHFAKHYVIGQAPVTAFDN